MTALPEAPTMKGLPGLAQDASGTSLVPQPWMAAAETQKVVAALQARGTGVRYVGGCVRDALAGRAVKDVDLATPDPPDQVVLLLTAAAIKVVPTGLAHGTVTAVAGGRPFEITTLRHDVETDGRRAKVAFTDDWVADAARRDFTMNALSAAPDGALFDPFGGIADLAAGRVRFVGMPEQRIREDVLRILRFFRFHATHGQGAPDAAGLAACRALAALLPTLSAERIQAEMLRLLEAPDPAPTVALMLANAILAPILPELVDHRRLAALVEIERGRGGGDRIRRLAALIRPGTPDGPVVAERLRLSNADKRRLTVLASPPVAIAAIALARDERSWRRVLQTYGAGDVRDLATLAWADEALLAPVPEADARAFADLIGLAEDWRPIPFPLAGRDVQALGVPPGPEIGRLLEAAKRWWEAEDYRPERKQCMAKLKELVAAR
jgi:poly(A) polymerase